MGIKYSVNENFFAAWSPNMAYVLGFFYADGTMVDDRISRGKYVRFINTDLTILQNIKHVLGSEHSIFTTKATANRKAKHVLSIGNKKLFFDLQKIGLAPKKSLIVEFPLIPDQYINDFVRGYCDGDGCIHVEKQRNILRLIFTSGSLKFLTGLAAAISSTNNIGHKKVYDGHRSFQLKYSQNDAIAVLTYIYKNMKSGLYLERKKRIFDDYMKTIK